MPRRRAGQPLNWPARTNDSFTFRSSLATELARHHVDTEVCVDIADALVAAGTLRPDAVLLGGEQQGLTRTTVVTAPRKRTRVPVMVGFGADDGATAAAVLAAGATACVPRRYRAAELIAILRAIHPETVGMVEPALKCGRLLLDPATMEVRHNVEGSFSRCVSTGFCAT